MSRRLKPEEVSLWNQVAQTLKPLEGRPQAPPLPRVRPEVRPRAEPVAPELSPAQRKISVTQATLDNVWDRKVRKGEILPDLIIDLHGHSREAAYAVLARGLQKAHGRHARVVLVITGKGKTGSAWPDQGPGILKEALPQWLSSPALRGYIAALRPAHPRHGGDGAWYVILKRTRP